VECTEAMVKVTCPPYFLQASVLTSLQTDEMPWFHDR
jgi:hypothetical protein